MEDREDNVRNVVGEEAKEERIRELVKVLPVEKALLENVGLALNVVLVNAVTGARNRNAEFDDEVLGELAFRIKHLEVLVVGNALEEVLELKLEVRL